VPYRRRADGTRAGGAAVRQTRPVTRAVVVPALVATVAAVALSGCGSPDGGGACDDDGALDGTSYVLVERPRSGERVASGFEVRGCSRTFESTVVWRLRARDGSTLAQGHAEGGGQQAGTFAFRVRFRVQARQLGTLEVAEPRVTDEGPPPLRTVLPLVLRT
jgi:hypothetical protein